MLDVISKEDYFSALDDSTVADFLKASPNDLKRVQDAYIFNLLKDVSGLRVIEVGGGNSRLLRSLSKLNELWNLDEFAGRDGGPGSVVAIEGIKTIVGRLGSNSKDLPENYFDVLFSISVIEHLPTEDSIVRFFRDGARVLKAGGLMHHAIDLYIQDDPFEYSSNRVEMYSKLATQDGLLFVEKPAIDRSIRFRCRYATNPDTGMYGWNKAVPELSALRIASQSVSLKMVLAKVD